MKIGVKFCGGCNPRYERSKAYNTIVNEFKEKATIEVANNYEQYDVLVVLGGCTNCCPNLSEIKYKNSPVFVKDINEMNSILNTLNFIIEGEDCN